MNPVYYAYEQEAFIEEMQLSPNETTLRFFPTSEGFYDFENKEYIYQYKDHLGNVRLSYKDDGYPLVVDSNDYYPFGMSFVRNDEEEAVFGAGSFYNYKYNGKELQETGMYDYGWRQYMPDIGRWYGMDQLSEMYHSLSPYNYVANNPVNFVDPDGRCIKNEQGDRCDDSPGGANNPYLIEEVVVTGKKKTVQVEAIAETQVSMWGGLFGIGYLGMGSGGSGGGGLGGGWGSPGNGGLGGGGGGAPSPIKLRPVDEIEAQMNRKQQLEYERLQNKINQVNKGVSAAMIGNTVKTELITQAGKTGDLASFTKGYLKVFRGAGILGSVMTTGYSGYTAYGQFQEGGLNKVFDNRDIYDATVGGIGLAATGAVYFGLMSNPVGWAIGTGVLIYGAGTLIYDHYNP